MEHYLFNQMAFVREQTLKLLGGVTEETADRIPDRFRNSIRWNVGHIYVVLERFAFKYIGLPLHVPEGYQTQFEWSTSPLDGHGLTAPTLIELKQLLSEQPERIKQALGNRMNEEIVPPYTTSTGITLATPEQFISLNLYHEGMHASVIKHYKRLLSEGQT